MFYYPLPTIQFWLLILSLIFLLSFLAAIVVLFTDLCLTIATMTLFKGPFFARSGLARINQVKKLADFKPGQKVVDLGSGDADLVLAAGEKGAAALGLEINPWLVFKSRQKVKKCGLEKLVKIKLADFWKVNLNGFDVIMIYGISYMMEKLEKKLLQEVKKPTKIISVCFPFPNLKPSKHLSQVYLYNLKGS